MLSLFHKQKASPVHVVKLPTYCIPTTESTDLDAKRQARLEWMREKGMSYLGDPLAAAEKKAQPPLSAVRMRLVNVRQQASAYVPRARGA